MAGVASCAMSVACSSNQSAPQQCSTSAPVLLESSASPATTSEVVAKSGEVLKIQVPLLGATCEDTMSLLYWDRDLPTQMLLGLAFVPQLDAGASTPIALLTHMPSFAGCHTLTLVASPVSNVGVNGAVIDPTHATSVGWSVRDSSTVKAGCEP